MYDAVNQVTRVRDGLGGATSLGYDANGNVTSLTDPRGKITLWGYDDADHVTSSTDARAKVSSATYDSAGRLTATTSRAGVRTDVRLRRARPRHHGEVRRTASGQQSQQTYAYDSPTASRRSPTRPAAPRRSATTRSTGWPPPRVRRAR